MSCENLVLRALKGLDVDKYERKEMLTLTFIYVHGVLILSLSLHNRNIKPCCRRWSDFPRVLGKKKNYHGFLLHFALLS